MNISSDATDRVQLAIEYARTTVTYIIVISTLISGIGYMFLYTPIGGLAFIGAGLVLIPQVQTKIAAKTGTDMTTITVLGLYGTLFIIGAALGLSQVDMSQTPGFVPGV